EAAGIIEDGVQEGLHLSAAGTWHIGPAEHVGLPDLIAASAFKLLARGSGQELPCGESALLEEAIERRGGGRGRVLIRRQSEFAQQGGAGAVWVFALEAFDQICQGLGNGARSPAVLSGLGTEGLEA